MSLIDIKSVLIGFLTCTCMLLIMGKTDNLEWNVDGQVIVETNENGKYQGFATQTMKFMIDTQTGELYKWTQIKSKTVLGKPTYAWGKSSEEQIFINN